MRILVFGAGVLGSLYAARLREAGHDVTLLARGQRLAELQAHGVVLLDEATGRQSVTHVALTDRLLPDDAYDLIMVVLRRNQVEAALPTLAANRATPSLLFLVNNATGPDAWVAALGQDRVLLGFPGAGGAREGHVVRFALTSARTQPTTIGELDGRNTPRLQAIHAALAQAGFSVAISPRMDAWLRSHVALVMPVALALLMHGGDNYALARSPASLRLMVTAVREAFACLRALRIPVTPPKLRLVAALPFWLLLPMLRKGFATARAELVMARHARNATDEMAELATELMALARASGRPTPALGRLYHTVYG